MDAKFGRGLGYGAGRALRRVPGSFTGLVAGLAAPVTDAVLRRRRERRRRKDVKAVKHDWRALREGEEPGKATRQTRRRAGKRLP